MIVVADDFTGAAEIAAVSFERGHTSAVLRTPYADAPLASHTILDTDSRLISPPQAAEAIRQACSFIAKRTNPSVFKKVDSVLRGNVALELSTLARALKRPRAFLLPANPSAGRSIENRCYRINGIPLAQTEFAQDPTHPATTSDPVQLLGAVPDFPVHYHRHTDTLPDTGLILCEASTAADIQAWATKLLPDDLPAGGRDFFESILDLAPAAAPKPAPDLQRFSRAALVIQGTVSPQRDRLHQQLSPRDYLRIRLSPDSNHAPSLANAAQSIRAKLATNGLATLEFERLETTPPHAAAEIERTLKTLFTQLLETPSPLATPLHLLIEGGATAALILKTLQLTQLEVTHLWAGGVVSLTTQKHHSLLVTTKPGSYPWAPSLLDSFNLQPSLLAKPIS